MKKIKEVIFIGNVVVETDSLLVATDVAMEAIKKKAVNGVITINGDSYRWSSLQQFNQHNGFT